MKGSDNAAMPIIHYSSFQKFAGIISVGKGLRSHTVAVKDNGFVLAIGHNEHGQCNTNQWAHIKAVSAGIFHTVALREDGCVLATIISKSPQYDFGQCDVESWRDIVAVAAGQAHTVGLKSDGTVISTQYHDAAAGCTSTYRDCENNISEWHDIIAISAGEAHTVGLCHDGTVVATKVRSHSGMTLSVRQWEVEEWRDIIAISAGRAHTVGLRRDGTVVATGWDFNHQCQVQDWSNIVAISAGDHYTVGLRANGTVVTTMDARDRQSINFYGNDEYNVDSWRDIIAIAAGGRHTVGLKADGTVISTQHSAQAMRSSYYSNECDVRGWRLFNDKWDHAFYNVEPTEYDEQLSHETDSSSIDSGFSSKSKTFYSTELGKEDLKVIQKQRKTLCRKLHSLKCMFNKKGRDEILRQIREIDSLLNNYK